MFFGVLGWILDGSLWVFWVLEICRLGPLFPLSSEVDGIGQHSQRISSACKHKDKSQSESSNSSPRRGESLATSPVLDFSSVPGCSLPLGSGRAMLGSDPALSRASSRGGLSLREAWLELEEAPGLERGGSPGLGPGLPPPPPRSDSLRQRDSFPAASSNPANILYQHVACAENIKLSQVKLKRLSGFSLVKD